MKPGKNTYHPTEQVQYCTVPLMFCMSYYIFMLVHDTGLLVAGSKENTAPDSKCDIGIPFTVSGSFLFLKHNFTHVHTGLTEDHRNAVKVFVEKRDPSFQGR